MVCYHQDSCTQEQDDKDTHITVKWACGKYKVLFEVEKKDTNEVSWKQLCGACSLGVWQPKRFRVVNHGSAVTIGPSSFHASELNKAQQRDIKQTEVKEAQEWHASQQSNTGMILSLANISPGETLMR